MHLLLDIISVIAIRVVAIKFDVGTAVLKEFDEGWFLSLLSL